MQKNGAILKVGSEILNYKNCYEVLVNTQKIELSKQRDEMQRQKTEIDLQQSKINLHYYSTLICLFRVIF